MSTQNKNGYGKRSIWQWIGIYAVVALVVYTGAFFAYKELRDGGVDDTAAASSTTTTTMPTGSIY